MIGTKILGLLITDRIKEAGRTQAVLSKHSKIIRSRLGFHELNENVCSRSGIILLHLAGKPEEWENLIADLNEIGGLLMQQMTFDN